MSSSIAQCLTKQICNFHGYQSISQLNFKDLLKLALFIHMIQFVKEFILQARVKFKNFIVFKNFQLYHIRT